MEKSVVSENQELYLGCSIVNIRRNKKTGALHANVVSALGDLLISATLDYCVQALNDRIPK